ncbi:helix-turn-helix domain-containing protein [Hymenobacter daecheongensis]|uniref:helix-turn-helix domain-containing protein n=1 Tax=Hymenobacter daecheongensis TaxID=496053 RepID=UPI0013562FDE|nr:helix-turn-helix transcriptional regulator [Hymenobacter daecheongensis]
MELAAVKNAAVLQAFGTHIRKLREARGFSQQELADHADVAKATIQRIEQAKFSVTLDVLVSVARVLRVSLRELMDFPDVIESEV